MDYEILKPQVQDGVLIVTISRPSALNALNSRFFKEMNDLLDDVEKRQDIRVMVITGEGKAFVAGADIAEMVDMNEAEGTEFSKTGQRTFQRLENLPVPVIAAVNGFALGGGCELAMAADFRIASTKAKFGQPEVNLGLIPGYAGSQRLPRLVGPGNALFLLMSAEMADAAEALRIGLVQKVTEPEKLLEDTLAIARTIASKGPKAVRLVKQAARQGLLSSFQDGCDLEARKFGSLFGNEGAEGMRAFLEKRKPQW